MQKKLFTLFALGTYVFPTVSFAAVAWTTLSNPTTKTGTTLMEFIYWVISMLQLVGIPILVLCIIYAGFLMVTAGGNEEQITTSKKWIAWTLVGALIVLGAKTIAGMACGTAFMFDATIVCP